MSVKYICDICGGPAYDDEFALPMFSPMGGWKLIERKKFNLCVVCSHKIAKYIETMSESEKEEL